MNAFNTPAADAAETAATLEKAEQSAEKLSRQTEALRRQAQDMAAKFNYAFSRAFDNAIFKGEKLSDVMRGLALSVAQTTAKAAVAPVQNALSGALTSLIGGLTNNAVGGPIPPVKAFAKGGVVSQAAMFTHSGGLGVMGEAGPEAILPLRRGPNGALGVQAQGSAAAGPITINISTPDVTSFRRSMTQVQTDLARAVGRGARGA